MPFLGEARSNYVAFVHVFIYKNLCLLRYDNTVGVYYFGSEQDSGSLLQDIFPSSSPREIDLGTRNQNFANSLNSVI